MFTIVYNTVVLRIAAGHYTVYCIIILLFCGTLFTGKLHYTEYTQICPAFFFLLLYSRIEGQSGIILIAINVDEQVKILPEATDLF